jgi:predicted ABC-type ATPase
VFMRYFALDTVAQHIERVKRRAARGGHSASETTLRRIHASRGVGRICSCRHP